jgi:hypothetical protein
MRTSTRVGALVKAVGACRCRKYPSTAEELFHDIRDCYHKPSRITHEFLDGVSFFVENSQGYGRRLRINEITG